MISRSARVASSIARSGNTVMKAFNFGFSNSMRSRIARATSTGERCRSRSTYARSLSDPGRSAASRGMNSRSLEGSRKVSYSLSGALPGYDCRVLKKASAGLGRFDRRVWLLLAAMLVFRFGQGLYYPFSTIYFHNFVGIPLSLVGVGLAALAVASVASGLVSGPLADRYGRKPVMLAALSGSAATFLSFSFVGNFREYLTVCIAAGPVGPAPFYPAPHPLIADVAPRAPPARAY